MEGPASLMIPHREWLTIMPSDRRKAMDEPGVLARILYRLRAESCLTQTEVAVRAGWKADNTYYSNLERGAIKLPAKKRIADLERAFGKEPGYIENQLPRRDKMMLAPMPEPELETPYPMGPLPRISAHVRDIEALDDSGRLVLALEKFVLNLKEQAMQAREDQSESDPDALEPTA